MENREGCFTLAEATPEKAVTTAQIKKNDRLESLDAKAMSILYCGLNKAD